MDTQDEAAGSGMHVISTVFRDGAPIPQPYSANGQNVNPPLNILEVPESTKSIAVIMHDPDAPSGDFVHWLVWDIPPATESIAANSVPIGAVQGVNGMGHVGYMGPKPPAGSGLHHYVFEVYALDAMLNLPTGINREQLEAAMEGHILAKCSLTGVFSAES